MGFARIFLWVNSVVWLVYGGVFFIVPETIAQLLLGSSPEQAKALIDMRATYGGVSLGLGVFLALSTRDAAKVQLGLQAVVAIMLAMAAGRAVGMSLSGFDAAMLGYLIAEVVMAALAVWALRQPD